MGTPKENYDRAVMALQNLDKVLANATGLNCSAIAWMTELKILGDQINSKAPKAEKTPTPPIPFPPVKTKNQRKADKKKANK